MKENFKNLSIEEQYKVVVSGIKELETTIAIPEKAAYLTYQINISKFSYNLRRLLLEEVKLKLNTLKNTNLKTK